MILKSQIKLVEENVEPDHHGDENAPGNPDLHPDFTAITVGLSQRRQRADFARFLRQQRNDDHKEAEPDKNQERKEKEVRPSLFGRPVFEIAESDTEAGHGSNGQYRVCSNGGRSFPKNTN